MAQLKAQVDKLLTQVSSGYFPEGYVSEKILPLISVKQSSGLLGKYGTSHLRIEHDFAGGRGEYRRVEPIARSTTSYQIESHGLEGLVTEDDMRNVEQPFDALKDEVMGLTSLIWLGKEDALASTLTSTSILTQNVTLSGTAQFNDYANSDPLDKFMTARNTIRAACGLPPNAAVMDWRTANILAYSPQILSALGFTQNRAGQLSEVELAKAMGVEKLFIAKAVKEGAKEGQTSSLSAVWGRDIVFLVAPDSAQKYQVSLGYRVEYAGSSPRRVFKYDVNNPPNSVGVIVDSAYDMLVSNVNAGYLIKDAVSA